MNYKEHFYTGKTRQLHRSHLSLYDKLWSCFPYLNPMATIVGDSIMYGIDKGTHQIIFDRWNSYEILKTVRSLVFTTSFNTNSRWRWYTRCNWNEMWSIYPFHHERRHCTWSYLPPKSRCFTWQIFKSERRRNQGNNWKIFQWSTSRYVRIIFTCLCNTWSTLK